MDDYRKIIHIDMDAFYASVEQRDNPGLRGKPVVVGSPHPRGVVATASYEARKFGVHSAMSSLRARQLCPDLIFVPLRMGVYKRVSSALHSIFSRYTDLIEPVSMDEAFLDVTHNKKDMEWAKDIALEIKDAIRNELNLTASAGISYNKFLAKIASDLRKPDGLSVIHPVNAKRIIARLPVELFWGVGKVTAEKMHGLGIFTGSDLRRKGRLFLVRHFGKAGLLYADFAQGIDCRPVEPFRIRKSVGCEETYERDDTTHDLLYPKLLRLAEELCLRIKRTGFRGHTLVLKIKWGNFTQITRSRTLDREISETDEIMEVVWPVFRDIRIHETGVRLMGLTLTGRVYPAEESLQLCFPFFE